MNKQALVESFAELGKQFIDFQNHPVLSVAAQQASIKNQWFTPDSIKNAFISFGEQLTKDDLNNWLKEIDPANGGKKVGVIMAGNIPMAGLHDMLSVLASGNTIVAKLSSEDSILIKAVAQVLAGIDPSFKERIIFSDMLKSIDAVIATGSNNSSRYFEYYFGKYPHIIRRNRNSIAVLTGEETPEQIERLGLDIFTYFGLGCRNVSKVFIPEGYDFDLIFKNIYKYHDIVNHAKYGNNYDYNKTVYLLSNIKLLDNGFLLLKEDAGLSSPVAVLFYEYYQSIPQLQERIHSLMPELQCIVTNMDLPQKVGFGQTQKPALTDFADGVNTIQFLSAI